MSVLIFIDHADGHIKKTSLEALCYGSRIAEQTGVAAEGVILGKVNEDLASLGMYGVKKIHTIEHDQLNHVDAQIFTQLIARVAEASGATVIVFSNNLSGKAIAPRLSARLKAALVAGAVALPDLSKGFVVKKNVFSGKAFANIELKTPVKIISLNPNSYNIAKGESKAEVAPFSTSVEASKVKLISTQKVTGEVPLGEAEIVVSGGRGMKGPENYVILEEIILQIFVAD